MTLFSKIITVLTLMLIAFWYIDFKVAAAFAIGLQIGLSMEDFIKGRKQ